MLTSAKETRELQDNGMKIYETTRGSAGLSQREKG